MPAGPKVPGALGLWREIQALGYSGSSRPVSIWAQGRRTEPHPCTPKKYLAERASAEVPEPHRGRLPSTRRLAWLLVRDPSDLTDAESVVLAHVRQDAEVVALHDLARSYTRMVPPRRGGRGEASGRPRQLAHRVPSERDHRSRDLRQRAAPGLRRRPRGAGGAVEQRASRRAPRIAHPRNRLKMLKRQMYGRSGFELLRKRVLCAA